MAISNPTVTKYQTAWISAGTDSAFSHAHPGGADMVVMVESTESGGMSTFTATYDGVSLTKLDQFDIGAGSHSYFLLADPGAKTADLVITNTGFACSGLNVFVADVSGLASSPKGASTSGASWGSTPAFSVNDTIEAGGSIVFTMFGTGSSNATAVSVSSPLSLADSNVNTLDSGAPATAVGYVIADGDGAKTYTGAWTGTAGWSRNSLMELKADAPPPSTEKSRAVWI